jgi:hypothetical protein
LRRRKDLATIPLDIETAPRVYVEVHPGTRPTETEITVDDQRITPAGDPIHAAKVKKLAQLKLASLSDRFYNDLGVDDDERQELFGRIRHLERQTLRASEARRKKARRSEAPYDDYSSFALRRRAKIKERTTRGMMLNNHHGAVVHLEGELWAVRSLSLGGYYQVDLEAETCHCPDFERRCKPIGNVCAHVYAAAVAAARQKVFERGD